MPDPIEIQIITKKTGDGFEQAEQGLNKVVGATGRSNEALGMNRREWMRTGSEAAFYLTSAIGKTGEMGRSISQATGMVTQLGESFMFGGGVGVGIAAAGMGISALVNALNTATPQTDAFKKSIDGLAETDQAAEGLAQLSGATRDQASVALAAAKANHDFALSLKEIGDPANKPKNEIEKLGDTAGQATRLLYGFGVVGLEVAKITLAGGDAEKDRTRIMELFTQALTGKTKRQVDAYNAAIKEAPAILENTRLTDLYKKSIIGVSEEQTALTAKLNDLATAHKSTLKSLAYDESEATRKSGIDRIKIEQDTTEKINQLNTQLGQKIVDIQSNTVQQIQDIELANTRKLSEDYYGYAENIKSLNRDITKSAASEAKDRLAAATELTKSLTKIDADQQDKATGIEEQRQAALEEVRKKYGMLQLDQGKVYTEAETLTRKGFLDQQSQEEAAKINSDYNKQIAKLKKESGAQRTDAAQQKTDRLAAIAEREQEQAAEFDYRRQQTDQQYAHTQELASQGMQDQIAKAQATGEAQIAQARRTAAEQVTATKDAQTKQLAALQATLAETERGINHRRDVENLAYADNVTAAKTASATKIQFLKDESTENEKLAAAMKTLQGGAYDYLIGKALQLQGIRSAVGMGSWVPGDMSTFAKPAGWYASGGDFMVNRPTLIGVGEGGAERVQITPVGKTTNVGGITVNVYETTSARKTANEVVTALRAHGMAL
ncbi:MAG: hypothetical protein V1899_03025 [Planctomycetota bacterium]